MVDPMVWAVVCCFAMVVAIVVEMLTPSFGLLTVFALGMIGASIFFGFKSGSSSGFWMIATNLLMLPVAIVAAMHFMKHSPLLHRSRIEAGVPAAESPLQSAAPPAPKLDELIGQEGQALTKLTPYGKAVFGNFRVEVATDGKYVDAGARIRAVRVRGATVEVEPVA